MSRECLCLRRVWSIPKAEHEPQGWVECRRTKGCWDALQGMCGQHVCAEVKFQEYVGRWGMWGAMVSVETQCGSHVLGIWRACQGMPCARARPSWGFWDGRSESMQREPRRADGGVCEKVQFTKGILLKGEEAAVRSPPNSLLLPSELSLGFWLG